MKKVFAGIALAMVFWLGASAAGSVAVEVGQKASNFTVQLVDGSEFTLSDYAGKVVFVNIWATWCGPCVAEIPDLQQLAEQYPDTLVVLGINWGEDEQVIRNFAGSNHLTYPQAADIGCGLIDAMFPTRAIPYTVVINPAGVVTYAASGAESYKKFKTLYSEALASRLTAQSAGDGIADLYATAITYSPQTIGIGDSVYFDSGVGNGGSADTGAFNIRWLVNDVLAGYGSHDGVAAGETVMNGNSQLSWTPDKAGVYTVQFVVDANKFYDDSNPDNNTAAVAIEVFDEKPPAQTAQSGSQDFHQEAPEVVTGIQAAYKLLSVGNGQSIVLHMKDSYDFYTNETGLFTGGDLYYTMMGFWGNNDGQRGVAKIGGIESSADLAMPGDYSRFGVAALADCFYVSLSASMGEGYYTLIRVLSADVNQVSMEYCNFRE